MLSCRVIVAGRRPLAIPFFDYSIPSELAALVQPGQLVRVPFRAGFQYGIVHSLSDQPPLREGRPVPLKPLAEILNSEPAFRPAQLQFLLELSTLYAVSPGFLVKTALFEIKKKNLALFATIKKNPEQGIPNYPVAPTLCLHENEEEKRDYILNHFTESSQNLILVPEVHEIEKNAKLLFGEELPPQVQLVSSDTSLSMATKIWLSVWSGETKVVIGTRAALVLPWHSLGTIFMLDEGNGNYKSWDMAPRFETRDAVKLLAKPHQARVEFLAHTPSAESYYFAKKKIYAFGSERQTPFVPSTYSLIDMQDEKRGRNYSFLADESLAAINQSLTTGNVLIFANRRGSLSAVVCRDCNYVPTCPSCTRPLSYHEDSGTLQCHFCNTQKKLLLNCERCGGTNLAPRGIGTQKIERELKKLLASSKNAPSFVRIDGDSTETVDLKAPRGTVIIGTEKVLPHIDWSTIQLVLFVDPDTLLFIPEYRLAEELWQAMRETMYQVPSSARVLVQTNHKDQPVFKYLGQPEQWYGKELLQRKLFGYPPFRYLLKLSYGAANPAESARAAQVLYAKLLALTKRLENTIVMNPLPTNPSFYKGHYWQVILIKVDYRQHQKTLQEILPLVPEDWKVDPNPLHLLGF